MTTQEVINHWTTPENFCTPRGDYYFNLNTDSKEVMTRKGCHDARLLMSLGRKLPSTKIHAQYWMKHDAAFDLISCHSIRPITAYFNELGIQPIFTFTKSKTFVRLTQESIAALRVAVASHFKITNNWS